MTILARHVQVQLLIDFHQNYSHHGREWHLQHRDNLQTPQRHNQEVLEGFSDQYQQCARTCKIDPLLLSHEYHQEDCQHKEFG